MRLSNILKIPFVFSLEKKIKQEKKVYNKDPLHENLLPFNISV